MINKLKRALGIGIIGFSTIALAGCGAKVDIEVFKTNLEQGNIEQVKESLQVSSKKTEVLDELNGYVFNYYNNKANEAFNKYNVGSTSRDEVLGILEEYKGLNNPKELDITIKGIEELEASRESFKVANQMVENKNWKNAFLEFNKVIESDVNYAVAQEKAVKCEENFYEIKQREIDKYLLENNFSKAEEVVSLINQNMKSERSANLFSSTKSRIEEKLSLVIEEINNVTNDNNVKAAKKALETYENYTGKSLDNEKDIIRFVEVSNDLQVLYDIQRAIELYWYEPESFSSGYSYEIIWMKMFMPNGTSNSFNMHYERNDGTISTEPMVGFIEDLDYAIYTLEELGFERYEKYKGQMSNELINKVYSKFLDLQKESKEIITRFRSYYDINVLDNVEKLTIDGKTLLTEAKEVLQRSKKNYNEIEELIQIHQSEYFSLQDKLGIEYKAPVVAVARDGID